jgi:hypothetical protein
MCVAPFRDGRRRGGVERGLEEVVNARQYPEDLTVMRETTEIVMAPLQKRKGRATSQFVEGFPTGTGARLDGNILGEEIIGAWQVTVHVLVVQHKVEGGGGDGGISVQLIYHPGKPPTSFVFDE